MKDTLNINMRPRARGQISTSHIKSFSTNTITEKRPPVPTDKPLRSMTQEQKKLLNDRLALMRDLINQVICLLSQNAINGKFDEKSNITGQNFDKIEKYLHDIRVMVTSHIIKDKPKGRSKMVERMKLEGLTDEAIERVTAKELPFKDRT
jgi:hypothetical protein